MEVQKYLSEAYYFDRSSPKIAKNMRKICANMRKPEKKIRKYAQNMCKYAQHIFPPWHKALNPPLGSRLATTKRYVKAKALGRMVLRTNAASLVGPERPLMDARALLKYPLGGWAGKASWLAASPP